MYTQCPSCKTVFEVTAEHLKAANGDVRCGQCLNVFSALDRLSESIPTTLPNADDLFLEPESEIYSEASDVDASINDDLGLNEYFNNLANETSDFSEAEDEAYEEKRRRKGKSSDPGNQYFYGGANEDTIEEILNEHEPADRELDEFTLSSQQSLDHDETDSEIIKGEEVGDQHLIPPTLPPQLLEDLQAGHLADRRAASNRRWMLASIALMLALVTQYIYFSRNELASNPDYRPLLAQACEVIGCTIEVTYDIKQIEIIGRDVRSHPTADKALIAGTTLINNASYPQPYPLLTLTFSNITGTKVAQRRFTPREYLKSGTSIPAGMTPELPVQVELELVDPGKDAINFEFSAEIDPLAVTPTQG